MSEVRQPDQKLAAMMASWPSLRAAEVGATPGALADPSAAQRWINAAYQMLPPDQTIVSDYRTREMLRAAACRAFPCGGTNWFFIFAEPDGMLSSVLSTPHQDVLYGKHRP